MNSLVGVRGGKSTVSARVGTDDQARVEGEGEDKANMRRELYRWGWPRGLLLKPAPHRTVPWSSAEGGSALCRLFTFHTARADEIRPPNHTCASPPAHTSGRAGHVGGTSLFPVLASVPLSRSTRYYMSCCSGESEDLMYAAKIAFCI